MIYVHIFYDILCSYNTASMSQKLCFFFRFFGVLDLGGTPKTSSSQGGYRRDSAILGDIKADGGAKKITRKTKRFTIWLFVT